MDIIKVVCGVIYKDGKVLICRRNPNKSLGGFWEFPGGKIENGESHESSLTRELDEELGMQVTVDDYFKTVIHEYEKFTVELIAFKCQLIEATFNMKDHDSYEWVNVIELNKWELAPADVPIADELINREIKQTVFLDKDGKEGKH